MSRWLVITAGIAATVLYGAGACAADSGGVDFSFSGFGTLGVVHSSEDKADFTSTIFKPDGAGYSHDWSADVDSLIAGQLTANFTPKLSAVVQVIAEQNYDNTYRPHVEWANIKYQLMPDFDVRLGRTVLPAFLLSDTRKVGYTFPWMRPPAEVYRLLPITHSDGLDASYRFYIGELTNTVQANVGKNSAYLPGRPGSNETRHSWGISNTTEYGALTVRVTYQEADLTIPAINALFDVFRQFGPQGLAIADKYDSHAKPFSFVGIGASYDPGTWFVMSEWGHIDLHSSLGKGAGWYASGGYRFGKLTPYVTYARATADNLSDPGLTVSTLPPFLAGPATGLNAALNSILSTKPVQNTVSAGACWDFMRNVNLKLQVDRTRIGAGSTGMLSNTQPDFLLGSKFTLFSAAVNFVF